MSKNVYDLIVVIVTAVEGLTSGICVYLTSIGKLDVKVANAIADSVIGIGGLGLGIASRFIKEDLTKKVEKK